MANEGLADAERVTALIELRGQARQRFAQLESLYWKVNFSIWGFLGAVVYLFQEREPHYSVEWWSVLLVAVVPLHREFLLRISNSQSGWRDAALALEDQARSILGIDKSKRPLASQTQDNDRVWVRLVVLITTSITGAVIFLIW